MELRAKYTFSPKARAALAKKLLKRYALDKDGRSAALAIGVKEIWDAPPGKHEPGLVVHGAGCRSTTQSGGSFLYHAENNQILVGADRRPVRTAIRTCRRSTSSSASRRSEIRPYLEGAARLVRRGRDLQGGFNSLPKMTFPGGALIGCDLAR